MKSFREVAELAGLLFSGFRRMKHLEGRLEALRADFASGCDEIRKQIELVRAEGHTERDSLYLRLSESIQKEAGAIGGVAESVSAGNASLAGQIERVRVEGHTERDSLYLRLSESISNGIAAGEAGRRELVDEVKKESSRIVTELFRNDIRCRWQIVDALEPLLFPSDVSAACPVCGHVDSRSRYETKVSECIFGGGRLERYVCPDCGAIFGPLKMLKLSEMQLAEEYRQNYSVYSESDCTMLERKAFEALAPEKGKKYLNFGAGAWNRTTKELREAGYDVYDYEPYAPVASNPWVIRSFDELGKMRFDGIFSNDLIEHLGNPAETLSRMKELLNPGGAMVHCSGCYEYAFEYTRFHLVFLTGGSLDALCSKTGLRHSLGDRLFEYSPARLCKFQKLEAEECK